MLAAIFTIRRRGQTRTMHAINEDASVWRTVCGLPIGRGSGLVRDGDYWDNRPCPRCWPTTAKRRT
jgi:hypothetical protein